MLDWPAFGTALWAVSDQLGIRPEWQLPVLFLESGFDPSILNAGGCVGLNQFCPGTYGGYVSVPVDQYRTWAASQQLGGPILNYWRGALAQGQIRSSTRLMVAQLGTSLLRTTNNLGDIVYASPSGGYRGNCGVFDPGCRRGFFTVQDVANAMSGRAVQPAVQSALSIAYQMRPGERMLDPVYGQDFATPPSPFPAPVVPPRAPVGAPAAALVAMALAAAAGYAASQRARFS